MKQFSQEPIYVQSVEEFVQVSNTFQKRQNIQFNCTECGAIAHRLLKKFFKRNCGLLCPKCLHDQTCLNRYGYTSAMKVKEIAAQCTSWMKDPEKMKARNEKSKQTCLKKWNVENPFQAEEIKEKIRQTNLKNLGVENPSQSKKIQEKIIQTSLKKWGCKRPSQNKKVIEKAKQTCMKNHGVEYPMQSPKIQEKSRQTCLNKYGKENVFQVGFVQEKQRQTLIERYNVTNPTYLPGHNEKAIPKLKQAWARKSPEEMKNIRSKSGKRYAYNNQSFDSSWELAVWIWAHDMGKCITREPTVLQYIFKQETHTYFPDFEIDGQLVEVKGGQFFTEDGTMQNPYNHALDPLFEAKHQCGLRNGVRFWSEKEMNPILQYITEKYGQGYLNQFILNN